MVDLTADLHLKAALEVDDLHLSENLSGKLRECSPSFARRGLLAKNAGRSIQRARDCTERDLKESFLMRAAEQTEKLKTLIEGMAKEIKK